MWPFAKQSKIQIIDILSSVVENILCHNNSEEDVYKSIMNRLRAQIIMQMSRFQNAAKDASEETDARHFSTFIKYSARSS